MNTPLASSHEVIEATDANFDTVVLDSPLPVLVDFGAPWCAPCRALEPVMDRIASAERGRLRVVRVDSDDSPKVAQRYRVRGVPTVIAFSGGQEIGRHTGLTSAETLLRLVR